MCLITDPRASPMVPSLLHEALNVNSKGVWGNLPSFFNQKKYKARLQDDSLEHGRIMCADFEIKIYSEISIFSYFKSS